MMADKAKLLSQVIEKALISDVENQEDSSLKEQMHAFKDILIHDIKPREFADIYAQTIAYGMFAARLHDTTLDDFSRQEAAELIPKTNPFLRKLFQYVAGYDLDSRIVWIVDALADIFRATNVAAILQNFGKATQMNDPIIHFYETFLAEYDPALRKARGVWYTPAPVVNFIVRAVDDILKAEFDLPQGLADSSKIKIKQKQFTKATTDQRSKLKEVEVEHEVHKVQILDPATGTGTFLAEVVKHVYKKFASQQGMWSTYAENHLIPRLNGFELLMASYAVAHLKMDLLLAETGFKSTKNQRFKIYLTNSLEEHHADTGTLFASWLSSEANEANHIKRDTPVMVIMGNPPYSGESKNKGEWIMKLMEDYKKEPGSNDKLKERNPKWINDDYVKFLRYGQHYIEKNGEGVLAFINPHGFLDNPTFRGMRWNLLKTYDKIYVLDLHGNSKKKEISPDGSPDVNVFDIMQGVSINIFIKTGKKKSTELGRIFHSDLYGKRDPKYQFLWDNNLSSITFVELTSVQPNYFFTKKDFQSQKRYQTGFSLNELFPLNNVGIVTSKGILINKSQLGLTKNIEDYYKIDCEQELIEKITYRPFDDRFIYYDTQLIERPRVKLMQHFLNRYNLGIVCCKQFKTGDSYQHIFITNKIYESCLVSNRTSEIGCGFPLFVYPKSIGQYSLSEEAVCIPNLNRDIIQKISSELQLNFSEIKESDHDFTPIDILDYIYAVSYSAEYRDLFKEFLKIDFPRIPYPSNADKFWALVNLGGKLRTLHLLESHEIDSYITSYPKDGSNIIDTPFYDDGKVYINSKQFFDGVSITTWEFSIGAYQPAQKWLKDRKGRELNFEDILHYQRMIVALTQTQNIMEEIDEVGVV
jgi:predicted helicase